MIIILEVLEGDYKSAPKRTHANRAPTSIRANRELAGSGAYFDQRTFYKAKDGVFEDEMLGLGDEIKGDWSRVKLASDHQLIVPRVAQL